MKTDQSKRSFIAVVSGLPRSGTSLMMKMLDAGGMPIVTDHVRGADIDNPEGYYEFEKVKKMKQDVSWLQDTRGKAFKMVSLLLLDLPPGETYKVIFMERNLDEVIASQNKMLAHKNIAPTTDDDATGRMLQSHVDKVRQWVVNQKNISLMNINYNRLINAPDVEVEKVITFLAMPLEKEKMLLSIHMELYRNRRE